MSLNTTPRTFVTGEIETAAIFNAELRDAITGIQAAWTAWTPTFTNLTIGNATVDCRFGQVGKTVCINVSIVGGTTTTGAAAQVSMTLPVAPRAAPQRVMGFTTATASQLAFLECSASPAAWWNATVAAINGNTFGNGTQYKVTGVYEAA